MNLDPVESYLFTNVCIKEPILLYIQLKLVEMLLDDHLTSS